MIWKSCFLYVFLVSLGLLLDIYDNINLTHYNYSIAAFMILFYILMSGKYVGNRPIKLRKSKWQDRTDLEALEKHKVIVQLNSYLFS